MNAARVLLVDDNPDNLEIFTVVLSEQYRVFSYAGAQQALAALEAAQPDLLLLDIGMGPVNGLECLRAIRAAPGYSSIPAIALTAYARDVERRTILAGGFQMVVTKPVLDHRKLFAAIASLLTPAAARSDGFSGGDPGRDQSGVNHRTITAS